MSGKRYPEEFKIEAVKQVTEKGYSVAEVATRLGMITHSLYAWIERYDQGQSKATKDKDSSVELARLKKRSFYRYLTHYHCYKYSTKFLSVLFFRFLW